MRKDAVSLRDLEVVALVSTAAPGALEADVPPGEADPEDAGAGSDHNGGGDRDPPGEADDARAGGDHNHGGGDHDGADESSKSFANTSSRISSAFSHFQQSPPSPVVTKSRRRSWRRRPNNIAPSKSSQTWLAVCVAGTGREKGGYG